MRFACLLVGMSHDEIRCLRGVQFCAARMLIDVCNVVAVASRRPWAMLVEAQSAAHTHGFDFHKEIFDL